MTQFCKYGCGHKSEGRRLKWHQTHCNALTYDYVNCLLCRKTVLFKELVKHVDDEHPDRLIDLSELPEPKKLVLEFRNEMLMLTQYNKYEKHNEIYVLYDYIQDGRYKVAMRHIGKTNPGDIMDWAMNYFWVAPSSSSDINEVPKLKGTIASGSDGRRILSLGEPYVLDVTSFQHPVTLYFEKFEKPSIFGCDVCSSIREVAIDVCEKGHKTCADCTAYAIDCKLCFKLSLKDKVGLSICKFQENGCNVTQSGPRVAMHEQLCLYRPTSCGFSRCEWLGHYKSLRQHCKRDHSRAICNSTTKSAVPIYQYRIMYYFCYGKTFALCTGMSTKEHYFYLVYEITPRSKSNYSYILKVWHPGRTEGCEIMKNACIASSGNEVGDALSMSFLRAGVERYGLARELFPSEILDDINEVTVQLQIVVEDSNITEETSTKRNIFNPSQLYPSDKCYNATSYII